MMADGDTFEAGIGIEYQRYFLIVSTSGLDMNVVIVFGYEIDVDNVNNFNCR